MGQHNHAFTIAFEVVTEHTADSVTAEELLNSLAKRLAHLRRHGDEIIEACGRPYDTFNVDEDLQAAPLVNTANRPPVKPWGIDRCPECARSNGPWYRGPCEHGDS